MNETQTPLDELRLAEMDYGTALCIVWTLDKRQALRKVPGRATQLEVCTNAHYEGQWKSTREDKVRSAAQASACTAACYNQATITMIAVCCDEQGSAGSKGMLPCLG